MHAWDEHTIESSGFQDGGRVCLCPQSPAPQVGTRRWILRIVSRTFQHSLTRHVPPGGRRRVPHTPIRDRTFVLCLSPLAAAQREPAVPLTAGWRFIPGDDLRYAEPGFNDSAWIPFSVQKIWEEQGFDKLDRYAWYRVKFTLPSALKRAARIQDGVRCLAREDQQLRPDLPERGDHREQCAADRRRRGRRHILHRRRHDDVRRGAVLRGEARRSPAPLGYGQRARGPRLRPVRAGGLWWGAPVVRMVSITDYLAMDHATFPSHSSRGVPSRHSG